ncbi:hypothetical protein FisN_7Lh006 [Fistulifera solaris]|uniref:Uncharacterized protein n=1 Tax=Fistulifera solaris TaxID=1519565 RepID=A0A1Z5JCB4_FISSO|nr:hypothetical protein FisN_7Lh006 [Fistulifera solaris]|eukprot:GAX11647.1 hypothetical protein FisN_7Lh006 [Fistulifera solaris]
MGRASLLFSQCIVALTIFLVVVDHRELTKQIMIDTNTQKNVKSDSKVVNETEAVLTQERIRPPFLPDQVLEQYIQWHSERTLTDNNHRQYALIYYYCPNRAGNILHSMFNTAIWAIIHNRTILWKYDTDFSDPNTVHECQKILQRARWLPSWDEWAPRLNLTEPIPIEMDPLRIQEYQQYQTVVFPMIPDQMSRHKQFFRVDWRDDPMHKRNHRQYIMAMDDAAIRRTGRLYRYGIDYLLGMLFREFFTIHAPVSFQTEADDFTVALHSRHTVVGDDGSFITDETRCLETLLLNRTQSAKCIVYLMSDRPSTVHLLKEWLEDRNCTGVSNDDYASMASSPLLFRDEHGPNPGVGFIRDLALVSQARSALVGDPGRSSFMLLQEIVDYDRRIDDWRWGRDSPETIPFCQLPGRYGKGYNYGPGTPRFIAHWHNQLLEPVQVLQQYKSEHSDDALKKLENPSNQSYLIGYLPCSLEDDSIEEKLRSFLHDFLLAIATNRTLLVKYTNKTTICSRPAISVQEWLPSYDEWKESFPVRELSGNSLKPNRTSFTSLAKHELKTLLAKKNSSVITAPSELLDMLYKEGTNFLYGALLHESIQLRSTFETTLSPDPQGIRVLWYDTGDLHGHMTFILQETSRCLEPVLSNATDACQITFLQAQGDSDQVKVISNYFPTCTIIEVQAIMLPDLLQLSRDPTWSAFAGPREGLMTSVSSLLRESLVYQRREVIWKLGRFPPSVPDVLLCEY